MRRPTLLPLPACLLLILLPGFSAAQAPPRTASDPASLERLAEQSFEEDDLETAMALYRQLAAQAAAPAERVRFDTTVAWIEHLLGRDTEALKTLTASLVRVPDQTFQSELYSDAFRDLFYEAQKRALAERDRSSALRLNAGVESLQAKRYDEARRHFNEALAVQPGHPQSIYYLALVDLQEGNAEEALAGFQKVLALTATQPTAITPALRARALTNLGSLYTERERYAEAEEALIEAVELDAKNASAWTNLGVARRRLQKSREAADAFRRAYELSPRDPGVINNYALAYIDVQDWVSAVGVLAEATRRFPDNPSLWLNLGLSQNGLGNEAGAIESFEAAIRNDPGNAKGFASAAAVHLARYYHERQDARATRREAERLIGWRPQLADGWIYKGLAQRAQGELDGARESLEEARRLDPTRAETHNNLGSVYFDLGDYAKAKEAFERALAIQPDFPSARDNLAAVERAAQSGTQSFRRSSSLPPPLSPPPPRPASNRLGLRFANIDYSALGLRGIMVESVDPDSLASRADIRKNDLILKVGGAAVTSADDFTRLVDERASGGTVTIDLLRASVPHQIILRVR